MKYTFLLSALLALAQAGPVNHSHELQKRSSCTITTSNLSNIASIKKSCTSIIVDGVTVPAKETLDLTGLKSGTTVTFEGTTTFEYAAWTGPLIAVSGSDVTITGSSGHVINGNGAKWWDGKGSNGGVKKPKFFSAHSLSSNSVIENLNIKNTPVQGFSIYGVDGLTIDSVTIDNSDGDSDGGHNTDGFDIGSSNNVIIQNCIVKNQDDCLAINSGTEIQFLNNQCSGGHGISIGSVGGRSNNVVSGVTVSGNTVTDSANGIRIKTVYGATGSVKNITYKNNKISEISKYGIVIEGDYENGSPTGTPTGGVPITDLTVSGLTGSVDSSAQPIYILVKNASGWTFSDIDITGGKSSKTCEGIPSGAGVSC
ncbi:endo-polygalacturonase [Saccharomycopsis crataegensis]|uniref:endo-polygalacturonase n=1 Tax=Saccharomycopsis crataegensis TaxID=43959 RepID=A0AAV5QKA7_9ASCO|nr:endo-polygalacturonase [Saccharomycopsis crataegensis]